MSTHRLSSVASILRRIATAISLAAIATVLSAVPTSAQGNDEAYTAKILEFTTEPFFLTPYVDHLPASTTVPTPLDVLGHIAGAADVVSYPEEVHEYMRAVAAASPRVEVFSLGMSEEGREMILVVAAAEETIARLDEYKSMLAALADPRTTDKAQAEQLIATAKPIYWATGAIHSPETGSPEMLMELVYRLAVEESDFIREIRDNVIVLATPVIEVDGRAKQVDLHMARRKDPDANVPSRPVYWGKYVAHDNNRDGISLGLKLSQHVMRAFLEYKPTVFHDLHESASYLYTSTGRGPYNAWVDPIVINEWSSIAYHEVREMTELGVPGIYTHDYYDGWGPNYMFWVANMHNAIGRFYETQGAGDGSTRVLRTNVERQWSRPNTPLPQVMWSIRNNVNLQQSTLLIAMNYVGTHREELLSNFYRKSQRSVAKATAEGPAAYVFPASDPKPGQQARLLQLLQRMGVEVHRADRALEVDGQEYGAGSYIVRMDQPYSRAADMLLDKQYYNPNDPRPYDDVGWTLGPLYGVETVRVEDPAILSRRMTLVRDTVMAPGGIEHSDRPVFLVQYNGDNNLAAFRFAHPELNIQAAERAFTVDDTEFGAGSFIIRAENNPEDLGSLLGGAGVRYGFYAHGVSAAPDVPTHPVVTPRVAVMHTWSNTQNEGWLRLGLDEYAIPYEYISVQDVRDAPSLIDNYDVIVVGPSSSNALSILYGLTGDEPVPWRPTELTPNIGAQDQTDDMRGGLELQGLLNLANFIEAGGTLITLANSASLPTHFGLTPSIGIKETADLWARGGVFRVERRDRRSPLAYGYGDELGVYFNTGPVFQPRSIGGRGFGGFGFAASEPTGGPGSTTARRTGRGGPDEEDIVQGRPRDLGEAGVEQFRSENPDEAPQRRSGAGSATRYRTVFAFARDPEELLISGGIMNGEEMTGTPALVDVPLGEGHVVMFAFNPFWRSETLGSYALLFNAFMHHGNLSPAAPSEEVAEDPSETPR
jgi:hypothetical protein